MAEITRAKPEVVGFSVHIWNKTYVYSLIELVRKVLPAAKIVVGGPEVAFEPERIFNEKSEIDFIVQGEGEICFSELLKALKNADDKVPAHIAYRDKNGCCAN